MYFAFPGVLRGQPSPPADAGLAPHFDGNLQNYLSRVARRTLRDQVVYKKTYAPEFMPDTLRGNVREVVVRLRQSGYQVAAGAGGPADAPLAVRDAMLSAVAQLSERGLTGDDVAEKLLIELEVLGDAEEFVVEGDWTKPRALDAHIEPGIHGLVILAPKKQTRLCPTELIANDKTVADAIGELLPLLATDAKEIAKTKLLRFRTMHWYEPAASDRIVSLERGLLRVSPESVTRSELAAAIDRLAVYMVYRQRSSGLFSYQYEPGVDRYSDEDNLVRQVGATAALAAHARWSGKESSRAAAEMAIRHHLQGLTGVPGDPQAAYIATTDLTNKLGVTALLALALAEYPDAERFAELRKKLIRGLLWRQRPSGMFLTAFPPSDDMEAQDYFPGEALLAMACTYEHEPSADILDSFGRAIKFYHGYFEGTPSPAFVPWQVQAFARMAQFTKRKDYIEFVFTLSDWLATHQLRPDTCPWPDMWGGIAPYGRGRAGIATASYLEGFADALRLAREVGDTERARSYAEVVRAAARFVLQLQVRPEEAYFVRSPKDAVWGMRTAPALNLLRIDHCQHALVALMKSHDVLFGDTR